MSLFTSDVTVEPGTDPLPVTGPLTDAQLRASPVDINGTFTPSGTQDVNIVGTTVTQPVSGTVAVSSVGGSVAVTGPLTDTQLRATAVPISGTVTATGPLTDTQLRASPVPVSGTVSTTFASASTSSVTQKSVTTSNTNLLLADANTKKVVIFVGTTTAQCRIKLGTTASSTSFSYSIGQNTTLEITGWAGNIDAIMSAGATTLVNVTALS